jgi:hypothetical protein
MLNGAKLQKVYKAKQSKAKQSKAKRCQLFRQIEAKQQIG